MLEMRQFLVPPEVRAEAGEASPPVAVDPVVSTPERLALLSLLLVTVPVTAGLSFIFAPVLLPTTALVAYVFWSIGRQITRRGTMVAYCIGAGMLAATLNSWLNLSLWRLLDGERRFLRFDHDDVSVATVIAALVGLTYGAAHLLPMLHQLSTRSIRRTEAIDRCLISYGAWGMLALAVWLALACAYAGLAGEPLDGALARIITSISVHASIFAVGILRWARRRVWLGRVERGKVPGWLVCEQQRFDHTELEGLEVFGKPLFGRTPAGSFKVLARGTTTASTGAYRTLPIAPKYLIV